MSLYNLLESNSCKLIERGSDVLLTLQHCVIQNLSWPFEKDVDFFGLRLYYLLLQ